LSYATALLEIVTISDAKVLLMTECGITDTNAIVEELVDGVCTRVREVEGEWKSETSKWVVE
jgi:hypothetical protein